MTLTDERVREIEERLRKLAVYAADEAISFDGRFPPESTVYWKAADICAALREAREENKRLRGMFSEEDVDLLEGYVCADDLAPIRKQLGSIQSDIDDLADRIRSVIRPEETET